MDTLTKIRISRPSSPTGPGLDRWGAGERFVFAPHPPEKLAEVIAAINRWGMGREMQVTELDQLALSVA